MAACYSCGETNLKKFYKNKSNSSGYQSQCKVCRNKATIMRSQEMKARAVAYKGGKCSVCGYHKYMQVLEFHHLDSASKDASFSHMSYWGWKRVKKEINKCILLCANCHREIHISEGSSVRPE